MARMKLAVLGSTGSIGVNTLDVALRHPDRFEVVALSGHSRLDVLLTQCAVHRPRWVVLSRVEGAVEAEARVHALGLGIEVLVGPEALEVIAAHPQVDAVMAAIVGAAGLPSCLAAARAGKRLLLANKEALVVGGGHFMRAVAEGGARLIPIDSEHSAIFQCLPEDPSTWDARIDHIVLTASGGPFRTRDPQTLSSVTPDQACAHPTWDMGRKISVDSATMMNKALEVIEARWLFHLRPEQVRVVIHPQSILHSMVVCRDQSVLAQMGNPDMRVPIAYGLSWPERIEAGVTPLDWASLSALTFEVPDQRRYPALSLAWEALAGPEGSTAVLNAANEVAVEAFLSGRIAYTDIAALNARALERLSPSSGACASVADVMALDHDVRRTVSDWMQA